MSKKSNQNPAPKPSGQLRNNPGGSGIKPKGQVPRMRNPPSPPPKKNT
jgi:hypothetical protein